MNTEPQSTLNPLSSNTLEAEAQPIGAPKPDEGGSSSGRDAVPSAPIPSVTVLAASPSSATLNLPSLAVVPATSCQLSTTDQQPVTIIEAKPLPATVQRRKTRRNGRIACLPKPQRDMVNRMLSNAVPYKNIVGALSEAGFNVTERNISNWATGGHLEWRFEQDLVLQNRLDQDHLVDHLRRDDASELPEVGLQAAATRLSQILLEKTAHADQVEANLGTFSQMVDVLCRLNREIGTLQKQRDESRRTLGREYDPARIKEEDQMAVIENERYYSDPPADSTLAKPEIPPMLPPLPTSSLLANADREAAAATRAENEKRLWDTVLAFNRKQAPASTHPKPLPSPQAAVGAR
ncbi:MAG TPA: hypothetical protein VNZ64_19480 [Candidatus Acidoferrum sp.]|jgi:hypothetical protein|nr:hypothetical protein [Candidatus Acidoferrum sp.]